MSSCRYALHVKQWYSLCLFELNMFEFGCGPLNN